jgi:hypothetical protein
LAEYRDLDEAVRRIRQHGHSVKADIVRPAAGVLRYPYISAGVRHYVDLIDWDAIWSGSFYLLEGDPDPLRFSLYNLIDHIAPDGKGQRRIGTYGYSAPPYQIRPFLASGCWVLSERIGVDWIDEEQLDRVEKYLEYFHVYRTGRTALLKWIHVDEGFADNGLANWAWETNCVEATDLNCQIAREHLALSRVFDRKGDARRARRHADAAETLARRIEAALWNEETSQYNSIYNPPERYLASSFIKVVHYTNLWPLWVKIASPERAKAVIEAYILNENELMSQFGLRSMSRSNRFFNNMHNGYLNPMAASPLKGPVSTTGCSNWQGPVWVPSTYAGVMCLANYGYLDEARELAARHLCFLAECLDRDGGFNENYHSETGEGLAAPTVVSWGLLASYLPEHVEAPFWPQFRTGNV